MASELTAAEIVPSLSAGALPSAQSIAALLVRKRLLISRLLFVSLAVLHVTITASGPRDIVRLSDVWVVVAEGLILAGLALRAWAAGTLHKRRKLATTGPYAIIRHPLYAGSCLMIIGFVLLLRGSAILWIALLPLVAVYWLSMKNEERHLAGLFPRQWPAYAAAVPRIIPSRFTWPRFSAWSLGQWLHNEEYQAVLGSALGLVAIKAWDMLI